MQSGDGCPPLSADQRLLCQAEYQAPRLSVEQACWKRITCTSGCELYSLEKIIISLHTSHIHLVNKCMYNLLQVVPSCAWPSDTTNHLVSFMASHSSPLKKAAVIIIIIINLKQPALTRDDLTQGSRGSGASASRWHFAPPFAYLFIYLFISILGTN